MSSIAAGTTTTTGYVVTSDSTGALVLKTGASATTAVTIDTSQNVTFVGSQTLSGGTANGVAFLNGSKVVTSGSALTFNGTSLGVGSSDYGNAGSINLSVGVAATTTGGVQLWSTTSGTHYLQFGDGTAGAATYSGAVGYNHSADALLFLTSGSEQMRLTSTGLGIGTSSPAQKLHVLGSSGAVSRTSVGANANQVFHQIDNSVNTIEIGALASGTAYLSSNGAYPLTFYTNGSERLRLDSSGVLGVGVTPSAWAVASGYRALQVGGVGVYGRDATSNEAYFTSNTYNTAGGFRYITSSTATRYDQEAGAHKWFSAASGTAGNVITFTQAMTLSAAGNLGIGTTSPSDTSSYGRALDIQSSTGAAIYLRDSDGPTTDYGFVAYDSSIDSLTLGSITASTGIMRLLTAGNEAARIDSSGNLLVGTATSTPASITAHKLVVERTASVFGAAFGYAPDSTARTQVTLYNSNGAVGTISTSGSATSYNTTSDQRLKENIVDAPEFGSVIDSIQVRSYDWKSNGSHQRAGFIAQELVTVAPEAVHQPSDTEEMMAVDYSKLVPMLVKEIQSLRQRITALEGR